MSTSSEERCPGPARAAINSAGDAAASAVAGTLWTLVSPRVAFLYLAAWMLVALAALVRTE